MKLAVVPALMRDTPLPHAERHHCLMAAQRCPPSQRQDLCPEGPSADMTKVLWRVSTEAVLPDAYSALAQCWMRVKQFIVKHELASLVTPTVH
eukprot:6387117-Amphidinium_carterae.1